MATTPKPQRVLIAAQCHDHSAHLAGVDFRRFYSEAAVFARTQLLVSDYYGFDAPNNMWDIYNIEAEALGQKMIYGPRAMPDIDRMHPLVAERSDLDHVRPPDLRRSGRMPWVHQINRIYIEKTGKPARGYFCAPFSLAVNIRGYVNFIRDIKTKPDFAHRLLAFLSDEVLAPYIEAMRRETGLPNLTADGADAWASPPNVTLDMMDEFVLPYFERLRAAVGGTVLSVGNWGEARSGDPERHMALKLKLCPVSLRVLDPDLYEIGPRRVKKFALKHNAHITAAVDAGLVRDGPPRAITDRIRDYIDIMARDGRFILYLNQIPVDTPPQNIHVAVAACHTFGQYPIAEKLEKLKFDAPRRENFSDYLRRRGESIDA